MNLGDQERTNFVDWEADMYAKGQQINGWPFSEVVSSIMRLTAGKDRFNTAVLEIGCGTGNNVWFLAAEGFEAYGLDISRTAIGYASNRLLALGLKAHLAVGDMASLPLEDNKFDIVIDRGALTPNPTARIESILVEARRVLKPTGVLMSFTLLGSNHPGRVPASGRPKAVLAGCGGSFESLGAAAFFTVGYLRQYFSRLGDVQITRSTVHDDRENVLNEEISVRVTKVWAPK